MRILMMFKLNGQLNGYPARAVMNVLMRQVLGDKPHVSRRSVSSSNKCSVFNWTWWELGINVKFQLCAKTKTKKTKNSILQTNNTKHIGMSKFKPKKTILVTFLMGLYNNVLCGFVPGRLKKYCHMIRGSQGLIEEFREWSLSITTHTKNSSMPGFIGSNGPIGWYQHDLNSWCVQINHLFMLSQAFLSSSWGFISRTHGLTSRKCVCIPASV